MEQSSREAGESPAAPQGPIVKSSERGITCSTEAASTASSGAGRPVGVVAPQKRGAPAGSGSAPTRAPAAEPASAAGAPAPAPRSTADPVKRKLIQHQLLLFLHARNCQRLPCSLPYCQTMKSVLGHMSGCEAGRNCAVAHCTSTRQIVAHWRHCAHAVCTVCQPLRQGYARSSATDAAAAAAAAAAVAGPVAAMLTDNAAAAVGQPMAGPASLQQQQLRATKEWQQTVPLDLRNHIVNKMVHAIIPNPSSEVLRGRSMHNLVSYARNVESDMYEMANSRLEYYRLIAAKIHNIQKEIEEKRRVRFQQRVQANPATTGAPDAIAPSIKLAKIGKPIGAVRPTRRHFHPCAASITASEQMQQVHRFFNSIRRDRAPDRNEALGVLLVRAREVQARRESAPIVGRTAPAARPASDPSSGPSEPNPVPSNNAAQAATPASDAQPTASTSAAAQEARKFSIQRCIQSLVHACQCKEANCRLASCSKMKRVVHHSKTCKRRTSCGCSICKQLVALCCHHARHCREAKCRVPFCFNIKQKLKQQQHHQRLQQAQLLRQKTSTFKNRGRR